VWVQRCEKTARSALEVVRQKAADEVCSEVKKTARSAWQVVRQQTAGSVCSEV
jgi:hypothetical protein